MRPQASLAEGPRDKLRDPATGGLTAINGRRPDGGMIAAAGATGVGSLGATHRRPPEGAGRLHVRCPPVASQEPAMLDTVPAAKTEAAPGT